MEGYSSIGISVFSPVGRILVDENHFLSRHLQVKGITELENDTRNAETSFQHMDGFINYEWHVVTSEEEVSSFQKTICQEDTAEQNQDGNSGSSINRLCRQMHISETSKEKTPAVLGKCVKLKLFVDPVLACCFVSELKRSDCYRQTVLSNLCKRCVESGEKSAFYNVKLVLQLTETGMFRMEPDINWSKKMLPMWVIRVSMDDAFSWLSTLGGAFSALGDDFQHFADKAGEVSLQQMKLAMQLDDPILQARCKVYMAQSLMQKGFIGIAVHIIRQQYRFALSLGDSTDRRLINMCRGVWSIIQYTHKKQKELRRRARLQYRKKSRDTKTS